MEATGIREKPQLLPALTRLTTRLPDDVRAQPLHKIQGSAMAPREVLDEAPGSVRAQLRGARRRVSERERVCLQPRHWTKMLHWPKMPYLT